MKIALIVPYFGKMLNYFELWMRSCTANPNIDWILFTDDRRQFNYPGNITVKYENFVDFRNRFQSNFDFTISLNHPYKLCDFKPTYGYVLENELKGYDFWGYCDIDMIFGDLSKFITNDVLNNSDKIFSFGHLTLYKNEKEQNMMFTKSKGYKTVLSSNNLFGFDEIGACCENINLVYEKYMLKTFIKYYIADINYKYRRLQLVRNEEIDTDNYIFEYDNGKIHSIYYKYGKLQRTEFMYIHLQKRVMQVRITNKCKDKYLIVSDKFIDNIENINEEQIKYFSGDKRLSQSYIKYQYQFYRNKLKVVLESKNKYELVVDTLRRYNRFKSKTT